ncbi:TetR family transcriptional regulator [Clostridium tyrobutyricum]|jgi:AcrR family transcriptional regulator|uniref:Transcriptional regulator, TetR family n=1 Tax=Clostridium tyrobutyricum DIVETGP TaxID=1408889 RepID=W6N753_CLOTY|nr:TetR-like C-terminal domain-containing protein [Clostridium tyrobutyricum]AND83660.1 TetR family transcriptional regulator [Clostridium tyrobutyricum]ANP68430.1 TetR family transcriptional regulator [Clostridium tyrobutyricum]MBR9648908.1 TetR/AcrR family transcriptional regulator C-terminal domain-containing protein [Clostridium tyrobutyricum]MBV4421680.1 TetR/AcrR family transcriptional regulator [Clostridium tyrobutyricum]MBV4425431.1 TetR/AcrR family transcriptional regulator [Clostridi
MKEKRNDRRVRYTKMVIKQSFIKLLKQKSISKISIKEICEDADINRATFYSHYKNQYDLLKQIENETINDINQYLSSYDSKSKNYIPFDPIEKILEYIKKNSELFNLLINSNGDTNFQQEIIKIIGQQNIALINDNINLLKKEEAEYIFYFLASGSIGIIQKWLREGMKKPIKEMAEFILAISINGRKFFD